MALVNTIHMISGDGESSYAKNSIYQENGIRKTTALLKDTIEGIVSRDVFSHCFTFADLGCSSGMNTLTVASTVIDAVQELCQKHNRKSPQIQACLNDLYGNDFNTVFKLLPDFYDKLNKEKGENFGPCFISVVPGSFYGRLFSNQSLHLFHSSFSLHWLSQVPDGIENNAFNTYMSKTSPPNVIQAYEKQFHTDFTKFLQLRSEETVHGGSMILTMSARSRVDPTCNESTALLDIVAQSLYEMFKEGFIQESEDVISFNFPMYMPCEEEVRKIVESEGSFCVENMHTFQLNLDPNDNDYTNMKDSIEASQIHAKNYIKMARSALEPLFTCHFGKTMNLDVLFNKYEKHVAEHLSKHKIRSTNLTLSITKK